ncbi:helix-turn-helix transcriptional regulator [Lentzea cavernae]|uniref:Helix-turn-helix domain-containing protein n=1 Tax=Lentzea cavernae TaxID=2020703 RepID=A0ABQ3MRZ1_9PSEU|nr:helix-turn-helix domain-containing protein [Lentzea cavernae]GHH59832.1 helix-turn-helix domain-containing protein [Lentzea cavernae]
MSENKLWSIDEVSAFLDVPKQTLYQWRTKHYGPTGRKVGKYVRYDPEVVMAWFNAQPEAA